MNGSQNNTSVENLSVSLLNNIVWFVSFVQVNFLHLKYHLSDEVC